MPEHDILRWSLFNIAFVHTLMLRLTQLGQNDGIDVAFFVSGGTGRCHYDGVIKWKHFPRYLPFVRGIHRSPVNFSHKGQWRGALMFSLIYARINGWVNNREAGDLRRHRAHYDVNVMITTTSGIVTSLCFHSYVWDSILFWGESHHWAKIVLLVPKFICSYFPRYRFNSLAYGSFWLKILISIYEIFSWLKWLMVQVSFVKFPQGDS